MNATAPVSPPPATFALPSAATTGKLIAGGAAGLVLWEVWARLIAPLALGEALEPHQLVIALVQNWTGVELPSALAMAGHLAVGLIAYPALYFIVSRALKGWGAIFDIGVWALLTVAAGWMFMSGKGYAGLAIFWLVVSALAASRWINPNATLANALSWGSFTWFNALGIMAPLAGMSFLLLDDSAWFTAMSWAGHVIYGATAALVFEALNRRG